MYFQFRTLDDGPSLACFETDKIPVDTEEVFEGLCEDVHGNKYEEYSETSSCCECIRRVFFFIKTLNITYYSLLMTPIGEALKNKNSDFCQT